MTFGGALVLGLLNLYFMDKDINNIVTAKTEQIKKLREIVKRSIEDESLIINNLFQLPPNFAT